MDELNELVDFNLKCIGVSIVLALGYFMSSSKNIIVLTLILILAYASVWRIYDGKCPHDSVHPHVRYVCAFHLLVIIPLMLWGLHECMWSPGMGPVVFTSAGAIASYYLIRAMRLDILYNGFSATPTSSPGSVSYVPSINAVYA